MSTQGWEGEVFTCCILPVFCGWWCVTTVFCKYFCWKKTVSAVFHVSCLVATCQLYVLAQEVARQWILPCYFLISSVAFVSYLFSSFRTMFGTLDQIVFASGSRLASCTFL
ncbi:hypothetical protein E2542_SST13946 [Spatholobus suberectus]|nr:hypothetical protein E2542_SST13946 [Spatholobus suberectus]